MTSDLLGHASTLEKWFAILERVFQLATHFNIKFNIETCEMLTTQVKYCGRGVKEDTSRHR